MSAAVHTACDAAGARLSGPAEDAADARHPRLVLATTIFASGMAFVDGSVVNVALPAIGQSLNGRADDLQWVVNAYLLPLSALLLFGGAAGDRLGRQRLLIAGIAVFALASAACALAPSLPWLLAGRGLQGIGAALLLPNSLAILSGAFGGEARGRAIGTWAAVGAMMGAVGPVLGGWLIDTVGWRAIFLLNLPLAAGAIALALRFVRDPLRSGPRQPLDLPGAALATFGLGALTWGLTLGAGPAGWTGQAAAILLSGVGLLLVFLWVEHRKGEEAMTPLAMFASSRFVGLSLLTLLLYGAMGGLFVLLPYVLIQASGYSGTLAGAALLPLPLLLALMSPMMGGVAGRIGPRLPLSLGSLVVAAGFLLAMRIGLEGSYWTTVLPAILGVSLGMAIAVAPLTTAVLTSVDARHVGLASGFNSAIARTGGLLATALLGAVLAANGPALIEGFRAAAAVGALAALAAAASAVVLVGKGR